jgi:PleD family two-component response regulator
MVQPLALVVYERLLPGSQLVNHLQDLKYRVQAITDPETLVACAEQEKPMVVLADLRSSRQNICAIINKLRNTAGTSHIPVIAFGTEESSDVQKQAIEAGAALVVSDTAILNHVSEVLEQALRIE